MFLDRESDYCKFYHVYFKPWFTTLQEDKFIGWKRFEPWEVNAEGKRVIHEYFWKGCNRPKIEEKILYLDKNTGLWEELKERKDPFKINKIDYF